MYLSTIAIVYKLTNTIIEVRLLTINDHKGNFTGDVYLHDIIAHIYYAHETSFLFIWKSFFIKRSIINRTYSPRNSVHTYLIKRVQYAKVTQNRLLNQVSGCFNQHVITLKT